MRGVKVKVRSVAVMALVLWCVAAQAQRAKIPEATSFGLWVNDAEHLVVGIVETVPGTDERVGFVIGCAWATGVLEGSLAVGFSPPGKRVRASVRAPSGRVERFGPEVAGRSEVLRLMNAAMADGALISNGHNSIWNRVGKKNKEAREELLACARVRG